MRKSTIKRILAVIVAVLMMQGSICALALDGVYHEPTGWDDLYGGNEVTSNDCERYPRDPVAGDNVYIKIKTWPVEPGDAVWVTWSKKWR